MKVWYFLDTNIFRNLVESRDNAGMSFLRVNRRCFRLTPTTIMELVEDLLTCKAHNFLQRREALVLARSVSGGAVLPAQGEFLAKHVFKTPFANPNLSPRTVAKWLDVVTRYESKSQLGTEVTMNDIYVAKLDVAYISQNNQALRSHYLTMMSGYKDALLALTQISHVPRGGPLDGDDAKLFIRFTKSQDWKRLYVRIMSKTVGPEIVEIYKLDELFPQLEPAWEFVSTVMRQSLCEGYRFDRNANDVMDEAQLHYLCVPHLVFVTRDGKLSAKVPTFAGSRVITFDQLQGSL
jgi:hypothetical protein